MSNKYKVAVNEDSEDDYNTNPLLPNEGTGATDFKSTDDSINSEVDTLVSDGYEFKEVGYRWVICIFFTLNFLGRSISVVGFTSVSKILIDIYGIDTFTITMLVMPFNVMTLLFLVPYNWISINYGLRIPTYIACV